MIIGGYILNSQAHKFYSMSIVFDQDDTTWCVKRAKAQPVYFHFYHIIELRTQYYLLVLVYVYAILFYLLSMFEPDRRIRRMDILNMTYGTTLAAAIGFSNGFKPKSLPLRFLYGIMTLLGFALTMMWCSFLLSYATKQRYEKQISTFDQLIENGFKLRCSAMTYSSIFNQNKVKFDR